ncbi:MAG: hypothetical protein ACRC6T_00745 [Sarcina sp.]
MVKRVILEEGLDYYTDMNKVFEAINNAQLEYNFLITDYEGYPKDEKINLVLARNYSWLSGEELTRIVQKEEFQWSWGVLIAFPKDVSLEDILNVDLPYADGNPQIWGKDAVIQNPLGVFEIIAFDSSLIMISSKNEEIISNFKAKFPLAKDL